MKALLKIPFSEKDNAKKLAKEKAGEAEDQES